ncbi:YjeO family protein [Erwiniaceae bacterium CAU 1747]
MYLPLIKALLPFYYVFCLMMMWLGGMPDYLEHMDGVEIKNICQLQRAFIGDDWRDTFGPLTLLMSSPFLYLVLRKRGKSWLANIALIVLCGYWLWSFYIQYALCF